MRVYNVLSTREYYFGKSPLQISDDSNLSESNSSLAYQLIEGVQQINKITKGLQPGQIIKLIKDE